MEKIILLGSVGRSKPYYNNCVARQCCRLVFPLTASALMKNRASPIPSPRRDHTVPHVCCRITGLHHQTSPARAKHGDGRTMRPPPSTPSILGRSTRNLRKGDLLQLHCTPRKAAEASEVPQEKIALETSSGLNDGLLFPTPGNSHLRAKGHLNMRILAPCLGISGLLLGRYLVCQP